jgi:hypothetical protein
MGIIIQEVIYLNEKGDRIVVDFADTDVDYRSERLEDLLREMVSGGKLGPKMKSKEEIDRLGPPPRPKEQGEQAAWGEGVFEF